MNTPTAPSWSVIICSIDAGKYAHIVQSYERLLASRAFEIIGIHDARSLAEAYNRGIARARGDILVFSHDDILILDDGFAGKLEQHLASGFELIGFAGAKAVSDGYWWSAGPAQQYGAVGHAPPGISKLSLHVYGIEDVAISPAQVIDGLCMVASRRAVEALRFDAETFDHFHLYDLDYSFSLHQRGLQVGVVHDIPLLHMSVGSFGAHWQEQRQRFVRKHAAALGRAADAPLPEPLKLQARVALFDDAQSLRHFWTHANLLRAGLAMRRMQR
jgi:glycosyltransferase involved in cell wall biosynthesis